MEAIKFNIYNVLILFGAFQGLLLIGIFLFNKNFRKKANYALVAVLLLLVLICIGNTLEHIELYKTYPILNYIPFYLIFLLPCGIYYFVNFLMDANFQFTKKDLWFIIPLIVHTTLSFSNFFAFLLAPDFMKTHNEARILFLRLSEFIMLGYFLYVILFTIKKVRLYHHQLFDNFSEVEGKDLFWLRNLMYVCLLLWVMNTYSQGYVFLHRQSPTIFFFALAGIALITFWLAYFIILRRDIFEIPKFEILAESKETKPVLSDKTEEHYQNLLHLIETKKLYQDAQLSMDTLAEKTQLSNGYLSKIINQKEGKNFYDFINTYRVNEVKANLLHPDYAHYSILGIGLDAGFKSKSTFNAVFKKMTGMTPSQYKKSL